MDSTTYFAQYHSIQASEISLLENSFPGWASRWLQVSSSQSEWYTERGIRVNDVAEYNKEVVMVRVASVLVLKILVLNIEKM